MSRYDDRSRAQSTGREILLSEEEKKFFGDNNNFIDYFIEIGVKPDIFSNNKITPNSNLHDINSILVPEIISKFPNFDKKSMGIDTSIIEFVFPHGFKAEIKTTKPEPYFYSLILDNQFYSSVYSYKYIACLLIFESLNLYKKLYDEYSNADSKRNNSYVPQDTFKNIYVPKCLCFASVHPCINKFELILKSIYSNVQMNKSLFLDKIIEKIVCSIPKIPRGLKKVSLKFSDKTIIDLTQRKMNELVSVDINLKDLFSKFKIDKIVEIFKFLLFETKTIFFGKKLNEVTNIIMSFLILLKPFTYQYQILSVLPKEYYFLLETDNPWIFGINEAYFDSFFKDNKLNIEDIQTLIVDIDKSEFYIKFQGGNLRLKDLTTIPKHLKEKLDKRTEEYKKNKKKEITNEGYQEIFYRFMVNLLKDYPKFLKKDYNGESKKITDMIDKESYLNMQSNSDKEFFNRILKSQMFEELITKRMRPKDQRDKIQALFFEEKLNVKYAQKKLIRGNKYLEQNILLPSKNYDYSDPKLIIDLSEPGIYSVLDNNTINFFHKDNVVKEECLPRGFSINDKLKGQIMFQYSIFPALLSEKLFKYNCKNYEPPSNDYNKKMEEINKMIINKCFINFDDKKKIYNEYLNDIYISYLIIFLLTFWYTDKKEREYRFSNMVQILEKIETHNSEVIELLFTTLVDLQEEDFAFTLHTKYLNLHLNPTSKTFSIVSKILKKKQSIYRESRHERNKSSCSSFHIGSRSMMDMPRSNDIDKQNFRTRTIKLSDIDDDILGEQIEFDSYGQCIDCNNIVNIEKICKELSTKEIDKEDNRFKCNSKCYNWCLQKINIRIGTELYNKTISNDNSSSFNQGVILWNPCILKQKLLDLAKLYNKRKFDVENFRINYPDEFWNAIWYFQSKGIDITFMLPYLKPNKIQIIDKCPKINKYIDFIFLDEKNKRKMESLQNNRIKSPNTNVEFVETSIKKFNKDSLFIQHAFKISIINIIGMIVYKTPNEFNENIGFNEKILLATPSKNHTNNDENKKEKIGKSNLSFYNLITAEFDLNNSINTAIIENNEEYNDLMDGNINCDEYINNKKDKGNKNHKVHFQNDQLFEMMKDDDVDYNILEQYQEVDGSYYS